MNNPSEEMDGIAALLSFVIPGAGQIYQGRVTLGFCGLFMFVLGCIMFVLPGVAMWIFLVADAAYRGDWPQRQLGEGGKQ